MMITVFSFLTTMFVANVVLVLLFFCCKSAHVVKAVGVNALFFIALLCVFRICFPVEFFFTRAVEISQIYNPTYQVLAFDFGGELVSVLHVLIAVWAIVAILLLVRSLKRINRHSKNVAAFPTLDTPQIRAAVRKTIAKHDRRKIRFAAIPETMTPRLYGSTIMIPNRDFLDQELEVVILHEYTHYKNRDVHIRFLVNVLCMIFWWIPALYLFRNGIDRILEVRCDVYVNAGKSQAYTLYYIETMLKEATRALGEKWEKERNCARFSGNREFFQRVKVMLSVDAKRRGRFCGFFAICIALLSFFASYLFVFQPFYTPPISVMENNNAQMGKICRLAENGDGNYTVVANGIAIHVSEEELEQVIQQAK